MLFQETEIKGAWIIDPEPHVDDRGKFFRAWCQSEFTKNGIDFVPVQANMGFSVRKGTTRGMHYQVYPDLEAKLMRCTRGSIFDVVLDLRQNSDTYGKWFGVELSEDNGRMLYIPEYCAHGYQTLEDSTEIYYQASNIYCPDSARGVRYNDPEFSIQWPFKTSVVSKQDQEWPLVKR